MDTSVAVLGDNTGALADAISLKGKGSLVAIARELSWRQAKRKWRFMVGHLPAELNRVADALSRVSDPKGVGWPKRALASAASRTPIRLRDV